MVKGICKAQFWPIIELAEVFLISNNYSKKYKRTQKSIVVFFFFFCKDTYNMWA